MVNHPNRSQQGPRRFDPARGCAFQGDIAIVPMPKSIAISRADEIKPVDGRLIIQEGEVSGHHHAIALTRNFRDPATQVDPVLNVRSSKLRKALGGTKATSSVHLYRDANAVEMLRQHGILSRTDLAIGCLVVEGEPARISHEEHDAIELPPGNYYIGRQVESVGAEERIVAD